jgi:hypothetical protein
MRASLELAAEHVDLDAIGGDLMRAVELAPRGIELTVVEQEERVIHHRPRIRRGLLRSIGPQ